MGNIADQSSPVLGVFREQSEPNHEVGLAAAHGLFQVEDRIVRLSSKAGDALFQKVAHTSGDKRLRKILRGVGLADDFIKLFNLVPDGDFQGVGLERASVADGFH